MVLFLLGLAVVTAMLAILGTVLSFRLFEALHRRSWLVPASLLVAVLGLSAHLMAPRITALPPATTPEEPAALPMADTGVEIVLVGLDGADWQVLHPMLEAGPAAPLPGPSRDRSQRRPGDDSRRQLRRHLGDHV